MTPFVASRHFPSGGSTGAAGVGGFTASLTRHFFRQIDLA